MSPDGLKAALETFAGEVVRIEANAVTGYRRGVLLVFRLASRGAGSSATAWTEVDVWTPMRGLRLELLPQAENAAAEVAAKRAVDVTVGDAEFDARFLVQSAPSDVVRALLDDRVVRGRLLKQHPIQVEPTDFGFRLARKEWIQDGPGVAELLDLGSAIAAAIPLAVAAATAADADAYRPGAADPQKTREAELAQLARVRENAENRQTVGCLIVGLVILVILAVSLSVCAR
jgi:hypothetical protein